MSFDGTPLSFLKQLLKVRLRMASVRQQTPKSMFKYSRFYYSTDNLSIFSQVDLIKKTHTVSYSVVFLCNIKFHFPD